MSFRVAQHPLHSATYCVPGLTLPSTGSVHSPSTMPYALPPCLICLAPAHDLPRPYHRQSLQSAACMYAQRTMLAGQAITFCSLGFGGFWRQHAWGNAIQFYRLEAGAGQSVWCGPAYLFITPVNTGIGMGEAACLRLGCTAGHACGNHCPCAKPVPRCLLLGAGWGVKVHPALWSLAVASSFGLLGDRWTACPRLLNHVQQHLPLTSGARPLTLSGTVAFAAGIPGTAPLQASSFHCRHARSGW